MGMHRHVPNIGYKAVILKPLLKSAPWHWQQARRIVTVARASTIKAISEQNNTSSASCSLIETRMFVGEKLFVVSCAAVQITSYSAA